MADSSFATAIMQSMVASMDPQVAMQREAMQGYLEIQRSKVQESKAQTAKEIGMLLAEAQAQNADPSIIRVYKTLMENLL